MTGRRGFTLLEILVSLTLTVLVGGLGIRLLLRQHWASAAQGERGALQSSLRAGTLYMMNELREIGGTPASPDILLFAPESLTYRAMRGFGVSCAIGAGRVTVEQPTYSGYRAPQGTRDSLLLHWEGSEFTLSDDQWVTLPILAVGGGTCSGVPGLSFTTALDTSIWSPGSFSTSAPARVFEVMQLKLYQSGGDHWLGTRSVSSGETIQPLVGPLASNGLTMVFLDSAGGTAAQASSIRNIELTLRALTPNPVRSGAGFGALQRGQDSLVTRIMLRNW